MRIRFGVLLGVLALRAVLLLPLVSAAAQSEDASHMANIVIRNGVAHDSQGNVLGVRTLNDAEESGDLGENDGHLTIAGALAGRL